MSTDPNLSHEAVMFYRETFRLCPNFGRRKDIVYTVEDLDLWKSVVNEWKAQKWNPLKVNWMLSDYERRAAQLPKRSTGTVQQPRERITEKEAVSLGVSEWRSSNLSCVPENEGVRFRANSKTLSQIVAEALRQNDRSKT